MTSIHDFVGGDYLKAADLNGQERTVRLTEFGVETLKGDNGDERKGIMKFAEMPKGMVINMTNAVILKRMFATDQIEEWTARVQATPTFVTLYTEHTQLGDGLRIRPTAAPTQPVTAPLPTVTPPAAAPPTMDAATLAEFQAFQAFKASQQ